jgi:aspartyl-tRNA(Asn)/glutamyl-tRNA(Gln) amidotransferase subunit A
MSAERVSRRQVLAVGAGAPLTLLLAQASGSGVRAGAPSPGSSSANPADLTIVEILPLLARRELSARELVEACIDRVERLDPRLKAFQRPTFDLALAGAQAADEARSLGRPVGPLAGVPLGLKDMIFTKGVPTTGSSRVMEDFVPDYDATVWSQLQAAGMVLLGKLASTEFAYGTNSPPTVNPWDTGRSPGGSSGGSAAAVSARMLPAALGGDTGGSIIVPAAMCGIAGLKATYGRCSRHGGFSLGWSCDHVGPMTRRVADSAILLGVMAGPDPADPTTLQAPVPNYPTTAPPSLTGVRIGLVDRFFWEDIDPQVARVCREGVERLAALGAEVVDVPAPPSIDQVLGRGPNPYGAAVIGPMDVFLKIVVPEATSFHRRLAADRAHRYSPEVLANIKLGETISAADYLDAQRLRSVWVREWRELFAGHRLDAVASPAVPTDPTYQTPSQSFAFGPSFRLTKGFNLNGFPSISVPVGTDDRGFPVGLQLAASHLEEPRLLAIAIALDEDVRFFDRKPPVLDEA